MFMSRFNPSLPPADFAERTSTPKTLLLALAIYLRPNSCMVG